MEGRIGPFKLTLTLLVMRTVMGLVSLLAAAKEAPVQFFMEN